MSILNIKNMINVFKKGKSAEIARNRLQIIIAQEKSAKNSPDYLSQLRQEIIQLVERYTKSNPHDINVELHRKDNNSILELNVVLPD